MGYDWLLSNKPTKPLLFEDIIKISVKVIPLNGSLTRISFKILRNYIAILIRNRIITCFQVVVNEVFNFIVLCLGDINSIKFTDVLFIVMSGPVAKCSHFLLRAVIEVRIMGTAF